MKHSVPNSMRVARILSACLALACSGRIDLGGAATGAPPEPNSSEVEAAAQTTGLMKVNAILVTGLVVDRTYLYLKSLANAESDSYYLQRCRKSDCWRSLTSIARLGWPKGGTQLNVGQLGWVNDLGLQLCHAPECRDVELVQGATFAPSWSVVFAWDQGYAYWFLQPDHSIYRCSLPNCASGPELVASNAWALDMTLVGEQLYWLDYEYGILRITSDGKTQPEQLTLQQQTAWVPLRVELATTPGPSVFAIAIEGPFIYAALVVDESWKSSPSSRPFAGTDLVRWRYADAGAQRELLLTADATFDSSMFMRVFDGEVVWGTSDGNLWSCLAENCAATKRQFGVDGNVDYGRSIASDEQYIYWLSGKLSGKCEATGTCPDVWNVKRTPRIPQ